MTEEHHKHGSNLEVVEGIDQMSGSAGTTETRNNGSNAESMKRESCALSLRRRASEPSSMGSTIPASLHEALSSHAFFASLPSEVLDTIGRHVRIHRCAAGDVIIQEGARGQALFWVVRGLVSLLSLRSETVLANLGRGAFFGETSALYEVPRVETVIARSSVTVAMLLRDDLLRALQGSPTCLAQVVQAAQEQYYQTKPKGLPLGHRGDVHYQIMALKEAFPFCRPLTDAYLLDLIFLSDFCSEHTGTILAFASEPVVLIVVEGSVHFVDPIRKQRHTFQRGEIAQIPEDASFNAYLIAGDDAPYYLKIAQDVYEKLLVGKALPKLDESLSQATADLSLSAINEMSETLGGAIKQSGPARRHSVARVFSHEQALHSDISPMAALGEEATVSSSFTALTPSPSSPPPFDVQEARAKLISLLANCHIPAAHLQNVFLADDGSALDLGTVCTYMTSFILKQFLDTLGSRLLHLSLSGCLLSDEAAQQVAEQTGSLQRLVMNDCTTVGPVGFSAILRANRDLRTLHVANCLGFDYDCVQILEGLLIRDLDISFCRNLGEHLWERLSKLSLTLERLTLHRIITLDNTCIQEANATVQFSRLRILDLSDCAFISSQGLRHLLRSVPNLEQLSLAFCTGLDETAVKALSFSHFSSMTLENITSQRPTLTTLDLSYAPRAATDLCLRALVHLTPNLEAISLRGDKNLGPSALKALQQLSHLRLVNLSDCDGLDETSIQEAAHRCKWELLVTERLLDVQRLDLRDIN